MYGTWIYNYLPMQSGPGWLNELDSWITYQLIQAYHQYGMLPAHGLWFSLGTPASSTTKTGCHDIAEILLRVALNTINQSIKKTYLDAISRYHH